MDTPCEPFLRTFFCTSVSRKCDTYKSMMCATAKCRCLYLLACLLALSDSITRCFHVSIFCPTLHFSSLPLFVSSLALAAMISSLSAHLVPDPLLLAFPSATSPRSPNFRLFLFLTSSYQWPLLSRPTVYLRLRQIIRCRCFPCQIRIGNAVSGKAWRAW